MSLIDDYRSIDVPLIVQPVVDPKYNFFLISTTKNDNIIFNATPPNLFFLL